MASDDQKQLDRDDLNREIAGDFAGRLARFGIADNDSQFAKGSDESKDERAYQSMLHMLLLEDMQYAKLYQQVQDILNQTYEAVDQALKNIERQMTQAEQELQDLRDKAHRLEDGTAVFAANSGAFYTEDGRKLTNTETSAITVRENAPDWDAYQDAKQRREDLQSDRQEVIDYKRDVLDDAKQRMENEDDPLSLEELKEIEASFEQLAPTSVKKYFTKDDPKAEFESEKISELKSSFDKVKDDIPPLKEIETVAEVVPQTAKPYTP